MEIAREWIRTGVVSSIRAETVRRILVHHKLKPRRVHMWMSPKVERDEAFLAQVETICDLSTRPLQPHKGSLQPRPRVAPVA